jgi:hypothetical protein
MQETTSKAAIYRLFQETDLPGVLALWRDHSGWGEISETQFRNWYLDTPYGPCLVAVIEAEQGEIWGQMVMIPTRAVLGGNVVKVLRVVAPILHDKARIHNLASPRHPAMELYRCLLQEAQRQEYVLAYTFPAYGWQAFMKVFPRVGLRPWSIHEFECYGIDLEAPGVGDVLDELKVQVSQQIPVDYDQFWENACTRWPVQYCICRDSKWLGWRQGGHLVLEMRQKDSEQLWGYWVIDQRTHLLVDAFAASPEQLPALMRAGIWALHRANPQRIPFAGTLLKVMYTPFLTSALSGIDLQKVDFTFTFAAYPVQDALELDQMETQHWYLMPND